MQLRLQVRAVFQQLKEPSWLVVDASQSVEQIHEQVGRLGALQHQSSSPLAVIRGLTAVLRVAAVHKAVQRQATCSASGNTLATCSSISMQQCMHCK
jgi:hypothetical protein